MSATMIIHHQSDHPIDFHQEEKISSFWENSFQRGKKPPNKNPNSNPLRLTPRPRIDFKPPAYPARRTRHSGTYPCSQTRLNSQCQ